MKFEADRLAMLNAAKNAARVAPSGSPADVLNSILLEAADNAAEVSLTATNHEVSIRQKVSASVMGSGDMLVKPRLLAGMLSLMTGEFVTFSAVRPDVIKVTDGKCVYEINCLPAKNYPKPIMPFPEETVKLSGLCSLARRTVFAVSHDEYKPALQCVNVKLRKNEVHAAACDGIKIVLAKDSADSPNECELLLPGRSLAMLASISSDKDVFEVGDIGNEIVFTRGDMMFSMRKLPGDYIDINRMIKSVAPAYSAVTNAAQMKEALELIMAGADSEPVNVILSGGQVVLRRSGDYSEAQTMVTAKISEDTPVDGFYYEISSIAKLFHALEGRIKLEFDAKGVMLVKSRNTVCVQMPRRAPVRKADDVTQAA